MPQDVVNWVQVCFRRIDCGAELSTAVAAVLTIAGIALTWGANRRSAREALLLRQETARQVRFDALPMLEVIFHRAPDRIFVRNAPTARGAAARVLLQGFKFSWNGETWRCTFEPTGTIIPGQEIALEALIQQEPISPNHERSVPDRQVFMTAFRRAVGSDWSDMLLALYFEDMLGNCYRSQIRIGYTELDSLMGDQGHREIRPEISGTRLVDDFPESLELVDRTR